MNALSSTYSLLLSKLGNQSIVMVGTMGAGKTSVGRRLAKVLELPFVDSDEEIRNECLPGISITEYCQKHGEDDFRRGEALVISRLLQRGRQVIATGDGAFCYAMTRAAIKSAGISSWLQDCPHALFSRAIERGDRPFLSEPRSISDFERLDADRAVFHQTADLMVEVRSRPRDKVVEEIIFMLENLLACTRFG